MSLQNIDIGSALRRVADKRIEEAMREGKFDNLEGAGKPLDLDSMPADEEVRMTWWALRIMRQNDFTPHEIRWRKTLDTLRSQLAEARDAKRVTLLVTQINLLVKQINTLGTNALKSGVAGVSLEDELARVR